MAGALVFMQGPAVLLLLPTLPDDPEERLFALNVIVGVAVVAMGLGGMLVVQAASAFGRTASTAMPMRTWWWLLLFFPPMVVVGQLTVNDPGSAPWLFPVVNLVIVAAPSVVIAALVAKRYRESNPLSWPVSWREWSSGFIYGAIGATTLAGAFNTAYLLILAAVLTNHYDTDSFGIIDGLRFIPDGWRVFFDVSVFSGFGPMNEEFWKGLIVALFFFRKGGLARCFMWGAIVGAGFNLYETFGNSLAVVSPEALAEETISGRWWLFATVRVGTAAMHAAATGLGALAFYGLFRRKWRLVPLYWGAWALHSSWNFMVYVIQGDAFPAGSGPDRLLLDVLGVAGLVVLFLASALVLWVLSRNLRDGEPAHVYRALGMVPRPAPGLASPGVQAKAGWPAARQPAERPGGLPARR
ncbi:MAG: hypothetical protein WEC33_04680 [Dehalococcoidia bacterium]